ncbi:hypothetical protein HC028_01300 [Planosporangium flavigriseum]|uniref:Uncharacterized protein n=1 Tax=Planosporangium flavigriseum TaxID=373681 RepID=A0A8J3LIN8_9ACTN|nr:hypothetical protein [Planosporangium flavigriseum]NJC63155.1 hypothetical protein [Planosporangium flavigriseum]GIG72427.1 hypothetical protein Pfl04_08310 [Planosporangium flavigriseum]
MPGDPFKFRTPVVLVITAIGVAFGAVMGIGGLVLTVPEWRAAHGAGRTGTFTLTEPMSCDRWQPPRQRCGWFGDFVSDDGKVVRQGMELDGGLPPGAKVGDTLEARDTGSLAQIYPLKAAPSWKGSAGFAAGGFGICLVCLLVLQPWSRFGRSRR